jgi:adenosylhomocysteine nucleosidase
LLVAAEAREFAGILRRFGKSSKLDWPAQFAREANWKGDRWLMIANGPGPRLVNEALSSRVEASAIISTGFCGALDPALQIGDVVVGNTGKLPESRRVRFHTGGIHSIDRVACTAAEKSEFHDQTGAIAIEMESAAAAWKAVEWDLPFYCIRSVSDTAADDLPLDFNEYRDSGGRFSRTRIAMAALARPLTRVPALLRLDRNCQKAAEALGDFFADCRF